MAPVTMMQRIARFAAAAVLAGVFVWLTTALLFAFFGWWAVVVPVAWLATAVRYRSRPAPPTLEHRLFAVGLARTNDV